jgi:hypothetical protein
LQARFGFCCIIFTGLLTLGCGCNPSSEAIWLYDYIPPHRSAVPPKSPGKWAAWAFLGNDDDGIFGESSKTFDGRFTCQRAVAWQLRNPFHNFCFYVIGTADRINAEIDLLKITKHGCSSGTYRPEGKTVFADEDSSLYIALHGNKPFISLRIRYFADRQLDFYFGWRERGNFGILFKPFRSRPVFESNQVKKIDKTCDFRVD